jgi:hypothetical protein
LRHCGFARWRDISDWTLRSQCDDGRLRDLRGLFPHNAGLFQFR